MNEIKAESSLSGKPDDRNITVLVPFIYNRPPCHILSVKKCLVLYVFLT